MGSDKLQPALLGGLFIGVLSALPFISAGNLCCCLWIVTGGALASYLAQQNTPVPIGPGDGATLGLLAGTIGALVHLAISVPVAIVMAPVQRVMMERLLEQVQDVPPEVRDLIEQIEPAVGGFAFMFVVMLILGGIFATLGGFLGAILFRKTTPPPPAQSDSPPYRDL